MVLLCGAIAVGCVFLYYGGDFLVRGAVTVGYRLGWSQAAIGLVLISLGTSAPELFVSVGAAVQGIGDIAAGNVVGSNIVNIAIVLGLGAVIIPLAMGRMIRVVQLPIMIALTAAAVLILSDGSVGRWEGLGLLSAVAFALGWLVWSGQHNEDVAEASTAAVVADRKRGGYLALAGTLLLVVGAEALVWGGVGIAREFGISAAIVALTVTALGTSLPEIAATLVATFRRQGDLAVGNVVGSNILNLGLVLGLSAVISPLHGLNIGFEPLAALLGATAIVGVLAWSPGYFPRWAGLLLLGLFGVYTVKLFT